MTPRPGDPPDSDPLDGELPKNPAAADAASGGATPADIPIEAARPPGQAEAIEVAPARTRIEVSGRVFVKAVVAFLIAFALLRFFEQVMSVVVLVALSLILAAVLNPVVGWLERHRVGRGLAALLAIALVILIVLALLALVVPPLVIQGIQFANDLPDLIDRWRTTLEKYPDIFQSLDSIATRLREDPGALFSGFLRFGVGAATTIFGGILLLTLTLYLLVDKERVRAGVLRQIPAAYRGRAARTISEVAHVVRAYFAGQVVISAIFAIYTFILMTVLGLPYAAILAAFAFFLDAIPNLGSLIATVLPALVGLTKSFTTAVIVAVALIIYNQIENNLIGPRIMGSRLKVPPVLTMIAILVGGELFGILGIIIAIPLAGTIPVIERIWFPSHSSTP